MSCVIDPKPGESIWDVLLEACLQNLCESVSFEFNGITFDVPAGESFDSAAARFTKQTGIGVRSPEESSRLAAQQIKETEAKWAKSIADAGAMTELELQKFDPSWPRSEDELLQIIRALVNRPHDYGTCVYAMSLAAVSAFRYLSIKVGASGFQASCADMDILRRLRGMESGFRVLDFDKLLYAQYLGEDHFPSWKSLLNSPELRPQLQKKAKALMADRDEAGLIHSGVLAHWKRVVSDEIF